MASFLPVQIDLAKNEDFRAAFEFIDEADAPVAIPAGVFSLVLRWRAITKTITLTPRGGVTNALDGVALLADLQDMPIGQTFMGDLVLTAGGGSFVFATLAITRQNAVQTTDDLGPRVVQVTRSDGVIVRLDLSSGLTPAAVAQQWAAAAEQSAQDAADYSGSVSLPLLQMATAYTNQSTRFVNYLTGSL